MGKKNLAALVNGLIGETESRETTSLNEAVNENTADSKQPAKEDEARPVRRHVGRPRSGEKRPGKEEVRTTFILETELLRKLKYISLVDGVLMKDMVAESLSRYISEWEQANGNIRLPKNKGKVP